MEIGVSLIVVLIIFFAHALLKALGEISNSINGLSNKFFDIDITEKLDQIYWVLGGKDETAKKRKELRDRAIKLLIKEGSTQKQAEDQINKIIEEDEFEKSHNGYSTRGGI